MLNSLEPTGASEAVDPEAQALMASESEAALAPTSPVSRPTKLTLFSSGWLLGSMLRKWPRSSARKLERFGFCSTVHSNSFRWSSCPNGGRLM